MKKKTFIINTIMLTSTAILINVMAISFRVYISNKIGAEGIGLFQLISTVYLFCATFATSGTSLAVTRLVTDAIAKNEFDKVKIIIKKTLIIAITLSILASIALYIFSNKIGQNILKDNRTILSLKILAPSLPFMAVSACYRGYFYAVRKISKSSSEQLLEQIIEILVAILIVGKLAPLGLEYACSSIVIGTTLAELVTCIYSYILYKLDSKEYNYIKVKTNNIFKRILLIALPVTLSSCLRSGLSTIENTLIPAGLKKYGLSKRRSLESYGMITGMVLPVIGFPFVFLSSFSTLIIAEISEANAVNHKRNIKYIATRIFQITLIFSIMITGILIFFSDDIGKTLYGLEEVGVYISLLSPIIPLLYLDSVVDGMLKGLNQQMQYLSYNVIDGVIRVALIYILVPKYSVFGVILVYFLSELLNATLSVYRLIKITELRISIKNYIVKPLITILSVCYIINYLTANVIIVENILLKVIFEVLISTILYITVLILIRSINKENIYWFLSCFQR